MTNFCRMREVESLKQTVSSLTLNTQPRFENKGNLHKITGENMPMVYCSQVKKRTMLMPRHSQYITELKCFD